MTPEALEEARRDCLTHLVSCLACQHTFFDFAGVVPRCLDGKRLFKIWDLSIQVRDLEFALEQCHNA
jgi:hypothetical protein